MNSVGHHPGYRLRHNVDCGRFLRLPGPHRNCGCCHRPACLYIIVSKAVRSPSAVSVLTSTNKIYGDAPNELPLKELDRPSQLNGRVVSKRFIVPTALTSKSSKGRRACQESDKLRSDEPARPGDEYFHVPLLCLLMSTLKVPQ